MQGMHWQPVEPSTSLTDLASAKTANHHARHFRDTRPAHPHFAPAAVTPVSSSSGRASYVGAYVERRSERLRVFFRVANPLP